MQQPSSAMVSEAVVGGQNSMARMAAEEGRVSRHVSAAIMAMADAHDLSKLCRSVACADGGFRRRGRVLSGSHRHQNGGVAAENARPAAIWFGVARALARRVQTIEDPEKIIRLMGAERRLHRSRRSPRHLSRCAPPPCACGPQGAVIQAAPAPVAGAALEDAARGPDQDFAAAGREAPGDAVGRGCKSLSGGVNFGLAKGAELWREFVPAR